MILKSLHIHNVFSYDDFKIEFDRHDSIFVSGNNGSGKSSLFESIGWCLFDKLIKGYSKDKVLRNHCGSGFVGLEFELNGDLINVKRTRGSKNKLFISVNGKTRSDDKMKVAEAEVLLKGIIGLDYDIFVNVAYSGQERGILEGSFKDKIDSLGKIFKLNELDTVYDFVNEKLNFAFRKYEHAKNVVAIEKDILDKYGSTPIKNTKNEIEILGEKLEKLKTEEKVLRGKQERGFIIVSLQREKQKFDSLKSRLVGLGDDTKRTLDEWGKQIRKLNILVKMGDEKFIGIKVKVIESEVKKSNMRNSALNSEVVLLRAQVRTLNERINELESVKPGKVSKCPLCLRSLNKGGLKEILNKKKALIKEVGIVVEKHKESIRESKKENSYNVKKKKEFEELSVYKKAKKELEDLTERRDKIDDYYANKKKELRKEIRTIKENMKLVSGDVKKEDSSINVSEVNRKIEELIINISEVKYRLGELGGRIVEIKKSKKSYRKASGELDEINEEFKFYNFWAKAYHYTGIKLLMIRFMLMKIELLANEFLNNIDSYMEIRLTSDDNDLFKISVLDKNVDLERDFVEYSGGEKKRLEIALFLALNKLVYLHSQIKIDFVIFDELFDGLELESRDLILSGVKNYFKDRKQFFVASHDKLSSAFVNRHVLLEKNKEGVTVLKEE